MDTALFDRNHEVVQELIGSLNRECQYQRDYLRLLEEEKNALQSLKTYNIETCSARREAVISQIRGEQDLRIQLLKGILKKITTNRPELKLTAIAERAFHLEDTKLIKQATGILKELILLTKRKTKELEGIVSFSMHLVTGSLSAILAHTQTTTPVYNSLGKVAGNTKTNVSGNRQMSRLA